VSGRLAESPASSPSVPVSRALQVSAFARQVAVEASGAAQHWRNSRQHKG
jgi:hypothetical protein